MRKAPRAPLSEFREFRNSKKNTRCYMGHWLGEKRKGEKEKGKKLAFCQNGGGHGGGKSSGRSVRRIPSARHGPASPGAMLATNRLGNPG